MATRRKTVQAEPGGTPATRPTAAEESIRVEVRGPHAVLFLEGVVGVAQARRLHQLCLKLAASARPVQVRCEHLQHVDVAGLQVLLAMRTAVEARGGTVAVQNIPDSVQQSLRHAGLAAAF